MMEWENILMNIATLMENLGMGLMFYVKCHLLPISVSYKNRKLDL